MSNENEKDNSKKNDAKLEEVQKNKELLLGSLKGWLLESELKLLHRIAKGSKVSNTVKKRLIVLLLENKLTIREIKLLLGVGGEKIIKIKKELEAKKLEAQEKLDLKTNQEIAQANALIEFSENKQEILEAVSNAKSFEEKTKNLEEIIQDIKRKALNLKETELDVKDKLYQFMLDEIDALHPFERAEVLKRLAPSFLLATKV